MGQPGFEQAGKRMDLFNWTGDRTYLEETRTEDKKPEIKILDLSKSITPDQHALEILRQLKAYQQYGDKASLDAAETYARQAYAMFCDGKCPLPKAFAVGVLLKTAQGEPFPDFYFHGAKLMRAFALLGKARQKQGPSA